MRLTHVAHLRLPFGALRSYEVETSAPGAELPVSFDQRRHVAAGNRPGSWMAISLTLPSRVDPDQLGAAWLGVIARHGTLRTVFDETDETEHAGVRLRSIEVGPGRWVDHPVGPGRSMHEVLREVLDEHCVSLARPAHRLCMIDTAQGPTLVLAADHAHVDMWSMLVLARDLLTALADVGAGRELFPGWVPTFAEHTRILRGRDAPEDVQRRWREIIAAGGDVMPRFPLPLGEAGPQPERVEVRDVLDVDDTAALSAQARSDGVSTLALAVSLMTEVTRELAGVPLRAVFPVHSRYDTTWHDSVGWFITNSVLESGDPAPAAAAAAVKEAIRLGSWPLEKVLAPWGGMPEAPGMFAISWLDLRRLPVRIDDVGLQAQYVSAATRPDGVMLWFILDEAGVHLRCRYPDTGEARAGVGAWLDALVARMQQRARSSAGDVLRCGQRTYRLQRAERGDLPAIRDLLADDDIGRTREAGDLEEYEAAFDQIAHDRAHYLAVVRDEGGTVVGTMQLTILPGLSRRGATRLQIEAVRVALSERSRGLGRAMFEWAHAHGRTRGASLAQLTTDLERTGAREF
ncbi:GNAT family N-acetyltransferase [Brachybacterium sp. GCM10030267]